MSFYVDVLLQFLSGDNQKILLLNLDTKPVRHRPYRLNPQYKERVKVELDRMLDARIIDPVEELEWISPMVVQDKK